MMISMLLMQMQQQTQQFSTVMGVGRSRTASPIVGGFAKFVVDNASAALKKIKCSIIYNY
jgi:predicted XRE-type DNA-binding protein